MKEQNIDKVQNLEKLVERIEAERAKVSGKTDVNIAKNEVLQAARKCIEVIQFEKTIHPTHRREGTQLIPLKREELEALTKADKAQYFKERLQDFSQTLRDSMKIHFLYTHALDTPFSETETLVGEVWAAIYAKMPELQQKQAPEEKTVPVVQPTQSGTSFFANQSTRLEQVNKMLETVEKERQTKPSAKANEQKAILKIAQTLLTTNSAFKKDELKERVKAYKHYTGWGNAVIADPVMSLGKTIVKEYEEQTLANSQTRPPSPSGG